MPYRESKTTDVKQALRATYYLGHSRTIAVTALTLTIFTPPLFPISWRYSRAVPTRGVTYTARFSPKRRTGCAALQYL